MSLTTSTSRYNPTQNPIDLTNMLIALINGADNTTYFLINDSSDPVNSPALPSTLAAGAYLVLGSASVANVDVVIGSSNIIQTGPDGIKNILYRMRPDGCIAEKK